jgi:hypothetical protein
MTVVVGLLFFLQSFFIVRIIAYSPRSGLPHYCMRNIFLVGLTIFQSLSFGSWLVLNEYATLPVKTPALSGFIAFVSGSIFLTLFLLFYKRNLRKKSLQSLARYNASGSFDLISLSITALVVGYLLRFVLVYVPVLGVLTGQLAGGAFSFACGIAAWNYGKNKLNPASLIFLIAVVGFSVLAVSLGSFGRRDALNSLMITGIVLLHLRRGIAGQLGRGLLRPALYSIVPLIPLTLLSSIRDASRRDLSLGELITSLVQVPVDRFQESFNSFLFQDCGPCSMFLIERFLSNPFRFDFLHSIHYLLVHPVPRAIYPQKPLGLGFTMASDAGIRNVAEIFNYGPGVIGHAFNDLVFIALPLYAYLLAKLISWLDRNALGNAKQPIPFVLLMGCAPAQMLAMARGELGLFIFNFTAALAGAYLCVKATGAVIPLKNRIYTHTLKNPVPYG